MLGAVCAILVRASVALASCFLALASAELGLRVFRPFAADRTGGEVPLFKGDQERVRSLYELDDELGYRPLLDTTLYDALGFSRRGPAYRLEEREGRERVVFSGDSVTQRQKIIDALRELYGDRDHEYWNAGVSGYNTTQEVAYFERHALAVRPDHVVLTFHLNDFQHTPISFRDGSGRLRVIAPNLRFGRANPWLLERSHLYRHVIRRLRVPEDEAVAERKIRAALERFLELSREHGFRFSVVVLPLMAAPEEWGDPWEHRHDWISRTLDEMGIRHFLLVDSLRRALADGVDCEETPGDTWHCSRAAAAYFAEDLRRAGLLDRE